LPNDVIPVLVGESFHICLNDRLAALPEKRAQSVKGSQTLFGFSSNKMLEGVDSFYFGEEAVQPFHPLFRLAVAPAMAACLVLGFTAIRRRDIASHRAWMIRAYALGLGAGTQIFTEGFGQAIFGEHVVAGDLEKGVAWLVNLAIAEWVIRRPAVRRMRVARVGATS